MITDEQSKAIAAGATFGTTVVEQSGNLARYVGRVLGTAPDDAVGLIIGDPLHAIRSVVAEKLDRMVARIHLERKVEISAPVSPSVAIPLLRAAYDETRPELQQIWAELIAAAMNPKQANRVRLSFIETVKKFDPTDVVVLRHWGVHDSRAADVEAAFYPNPKHLGLKPIKGLDESTHH